MRYQLCNCYENVLLDNCVIRPTPPHSYKDTRASLRERIPLFCIPVKSNPDAASPPSNSPPSVATTNSIWFRYASLLRRSMVTDRAFAGKRVIIELLFRSNDSRKLGLMKSIFLFFNLWTTDRGELRSKYRLSKITSRIWFNLFNLEERWIGKGQLVDSFQTWLLVKIISLRKYIYSSCLSIPNIFQTYVKR